MGSHRAATSTIAPASSTRSSQGWRTNGCAAIALSPKHSRQRSTQRRDREIEPERAKGPSDADQQYQPADAQEEETNQKKDTPAWLAASRRSEDCVILPRDIQ